MLLLCVALLGVVGSRAMARGDDDAGRALFTGAMPLTGRMSSHPGDLPANVVQCANCHAETTGPAVRNSIAPRLTRSWLVDLQSRRGGPPSRYDLPAFCRMLRDGIDPAYVLLNVEMPRYRISEGDCAALWRFLTHVPSDPA
ncbi:hypothetical protein [Burkholderia sp. Bp8998]|uniref:hypothetical protein n=1 Tax=Burkholderia sp. Bp8998 TaxID=2184557 RepID=UPI0028935045|nr:hypothetical protein [Burkholderia sp. Bp8998]